MGTGRSSEPVDRLLRPAAESASRTMGPGIGRAGAVYDFSLLYPGKAGMFSYYFTGVVYAYLSVVQPECPSLTLSTVLSLSSTAAADVNGHVIPPDNGAAAIGESVDPGKKNGWLALVHGYFLQLYTV